MSEPGIISNTPTYDLLIVGGGINGVGIARDAAGRGLSVLLVEKDDLAQATSSSSTKLFHGGLRYLEYFEFGLVRKALREREVLLRAMPHIARPMRFVLPHDTTLRYPKDASSLAKVLSFFLPFLKGRRPAWIIRTGLFVYDHLGGRKLLPATRTLDMKTHAVGAALKPRFSKAYEYSDCWVDDARLVVLNARDAANRGATVQTRTKFEGATREDGLWRAHLTNEIDGAKQTVTAKGIVNAGGPWVEDVLKGKLQLVSDNGVRLVRGSHIVTRKLFDHDQPYFLQLQDGRIVFAIPYEGDFTLIGTTDLDHKGDPGDVYCTDEEQAYLLDAANHFFKQQLTQTDIVWTYSGVRPLYDDGAPDATAATRDYVLTVNDQDGAAPLLNVFGGKITTYRKLAQDALAKLSVHFPEMAPEWTETASLPGGDFPVEGVEDLVTALKTKFTFLTPDWALRLVRAYGTEAAGIYGEAKTIDDLGDHFGATLYQTEVDWLVAHEWAKSAQDILWRRSKLGLRVQDADVAALENHLGG